jgi:hypothetical protein
MGQNASEIARNLRETYNVRTTKKTIISILDRIRNLVHDYMEDL